MQSLQTTSDITEKQIGDAFYQQQLINQQIGALTGQAFISGYDTTNSEYAALLTNGATFANQEGLTVGVGLTAAQMAQLTSDIVWLVSEPVTLPDGTVENALVPQVYLLPQAGDVSSNGALISANQIQLNTTGDVTNNGTIAGEQAVVINANNISNTGNIAGTQVGLTALNDLNNLGGTVNAAQNLYLKAGNDINISSTTDSSSNTFGLSSSSQTSLDRIAGLYVGNSGTGGQLNVVAGNDLNINGAQISNQSTNGVTNLFAGNDININPLLLSSQLNLVRNSSNYTDFSTTTNYSSTISSLGNLNIDAGGILSAIDAQISSGVNLSLSGAQGVLIANGNNTSSVESSNTFKSHGFLGGSSGSNQEDSSSSTVLGSTLTAGGTLSINSQLGNILSIASQFNGQTIDLSAANGQIALDSANTLLQGSSSDKETSRSFSLGGLLAGGLMLGTASAFDPTKVNGQAQSVDSTAVVNQLNAGSGGINILSQGNLSSQGTDFNSGGNITLTSTQGQVILAAVKNIIQSQSDSSSIGAQLNHISTSSTNDQTVQMSQMQYTGQLIVNAAQGISVDVKTDQGASPQNIQSVINSLAQQPGMAWLQQMQANGQIDYNQIQQIYQQQSSSSTSLGMLSDIMIAIAVTVATAGTGGPAAGAALAASDAATAAGASTAVAAAAGAAASAAVTSAAIAATDATINSALNGQGLSGIVNRLNNKATVDSILTAALTAGVTNGIDTSLSLTASNSAQLTTVAGITNQFEYNLVNGIASATVNQIINGGNLEQSLTTAGLTAVGNTVGAAGFNEGANIAYSDGYGAGSTELALLHGLTGAVTGYIIGGNGQSALAGGASSAVTELLTPTLQQVATNSNGQLNSTLLGGLDQGVGALSAVIATGNVNQAALGQTVAGLEFQYNYLNHTQQQNLLNQLTTCKNTSDPVGCMNTAITAAKQISQAQDAALADCVANGNQQCINNAANQITTALNNPTSSALATFFNQNGLSLTGANPLATNSTAISEFPQVNAALWGAQPSSNNPNQVNCPSGFSAACYAAYNAMESKQQTSQNLSLLGNAAVGVGAEVVIGGIAAKLSGELGGVIDQSTTGISWGQGIQSQGMPWEDFLASLIPADARLPPGFQTFDFFDAETGEAISAKTLDTTTAAKIANPAQVYTTIKNSVNAAANYTTSTLSGITLDASQILSREIQLAVPESTTPAQWEQINKAIQYGQSKGVTVTVTRIR